MKNRKVLLVGDFGDHYLCAYETSYLLKRSGFDVDLVTNNPISKKLRSITNYICVDKVDEIPRAALVQAEGSDYELVVALDDFSLMEIANSNLSNDEKLVLLPVQTQQNFQHIGSKIGLSRVLRQHGIKTPDFLIADNILELKKYIEEFRCPLLIKIDFSGAGKGVFECRSKNEVELIANKVSSWPILLQKKIDGEIIDLSAFYQNSKLIHFSYSAIKKYESNKFSPSAVRTYTQLGNIKSDVFEDLRRLGSAIGASGFANITCIKSEVDGQIYFIEADMRPNVWVNYPKYFGDDPAICIFNYFSSGEVIKYPYALRSEFPDQIVLPYFSRIKIWELAVNKYRSWSYFPNVDLLIVLFALANKEVKNLVRRLVKPMVPIGLWLQLKRTYDRALRNLMR